MVKEKLKDNKTVYICEECNFAYHKNPACQKRIFRMPKIFGKIFEHKEKEWAEKCEAFCKEHHQCSIEITAHAVK